LYISH